MFCSSNVLSFCSRDEPCTLFYPHSIQSSHIQRHSHAAWNELNWIKKNNERNTTNVQTQHTFSIRHHINWTKWSTYLIHWYLFHIFCVNNIGGVAVDVFVVWKITTKTPNPLFSPCFHLQCMRDHSIVFRILGCAWEWEMKMQSKHLMEFTIELNRFDIRTNWSNVCIFEAQRPETWRQSRNTLNSMKWFYIRVIFCESTFCSYLILSYRMKNVYSHEISEV